MKCSAIAPWTGLLLVFAATVAQAGPPMTAEAPWYNPLQWSWPSPPWASEPPVVKKKSPSVLTRINRSARSGWNKTRRTLSPTRLFTGNAGSPQKSKPSAGQAEPGFWRSLLGGNRGQDDVHSVTDFLAQPRPQ